MNIYEKIARDDYKNKVPFVRREDFKIQEIVQTKRLGEQVIKGFDEEGWKKAQKEYREGQAEAQRNFKKDALEHVGLTGHPQAEKVWRLMEDHSDEESLSVKVNLLEDLAELVLG